MPLVLAEGGMAGTPKSGVAARPRRPLGRGGLPLLCAVLALLVALPVVPLVRPIKTRIGGYVVLVGPSRFPAHSRLTGLRRGITSSTVPAGIELIDAEQVRYVTRGTGRIYRLWMMDRGYYLVLFRGHRK